jgi:hypothetical protein
MDGSSLSRQCQSMPDLATLRKLRTSFRYLADFATATIPKPKALSQKTKQQNKHPRLNSTVVRTSGQAGASYSSRLPEATGAATGKRDSAELSLGLGRRGFHQEEQGQKSPQTSSVCSPCGF